MKQLNINFILLFLLFASVVNAQTDTILLKVTTLAFSAYSQELDSIKENGDTLSEYYSFVSESLAPTLKNSHSINIKIQTIKSQVIINQYSEDEKYSYWSKPFDNGTNYTLIFLDSISRDSLSLSFKIKKVGQIITIGTNQGFYGKIEAEDTSINFTIRPFILSKNNICFDKTRTSQYKLSNVLLYGESFKIKDNYYELSDFNLHNNYILLKSVSKEEGKYGYKQGYFIPNFKKLKKRIQKEATTVITNLESEYYLFYFWGEWCYPCQKKISYNKKLYENIDTARLKYINIALCLTDESERKTLKVIKNKSINGVHLIEGRDEIENGLINILNNTSYPTSILVNNKGKILYRSDNFSKITLEQFLQSQKLLR